jgi:hypothetical protein
LIPFQAGERKTNEQGKVKGRKEKEKSEKTQKRASYIIE